MAAAQRYPPFEHFAGESAATRFLDFAERMICAGTKSPPIRRVSRRKLLSAIDVEPLDTMDGADIHGRHL